VAVLLITGLFVSVLIGDKIILSGVANEKKIVEKTENEIVEEYVWSVPADWNEGNRCDSIHCCNGCCSQWR
jgi:hypothetical protein